MMRRRNFLLAFGSGLAVLAVHAHAQTQRVKRVGVLSYLADHDPEAKTYSAAFIQGLNDSAWTVGTNLQVDFRWTGGDVDRARKYAAELVALKPDVIVAAGGSHLGPVQQATRDIPIVFVQVTDPVGGGFVDSLSRPGGNTTGFTVFDFDISAKLLEFLKLVAPHTARVGVFRDPANPSGTGLFGAIQAVAPQFGVEVSPLGLRDPNEIERGAASFARTPNGGLVVTPSGLAIVNRELIIKLAARHNLPAIYPFRDFATGGGLLSYGPDVTDQYRRAAGYVSRILRGEKPAELPVQRSTKFDLVVNVKAAKAIGLELPQSIILRADEVIR